VSLDLVQQRLNSVLRKEPGAKQYQDQHQLDVISRNIVTLSVHHELITKVAQQEGLSANEEQITTLIDQLGGPEKASAGTVWDASTFRERARDQLLVVALARKYIDRLAVTFDYTQASSRASAVAKANELAANPAQAKEIIQRDKVPNGGAGLNERVVAIDSPQLATTALFGALPGTVVAFPPSQNSAQGSGQWIVALIRQRSTDASATPSSPSTSPSSPSARKTSADQLDPRLLEAVGIRLLEPLAGQLGIKVNPRYGVWDSVGMSVAATVNETVGYAVAARTQP
jgi:hypothetical protein